jgi:multicomponent Na+:H+ antiporter subunit G
VADVLASVCLLLGGYLALAAGVGVLRFPDVLARMHAVTKPQVLGLILLLAAVSLRTRDWPVVTMLALVVAFQLATSPVSAHMVGRAAHRTGTVTPDDFEVDDMPPVDDEGDRAPGPSA